MKTMGRSDLLVETNLGTTFLPAGLLEKRIGYEQQTQSMIAKRESVDLS
jgi:hypothetical protein